MFNIADFMAQLQNGNLAKPSNFTMLCTRPLVQGGSSGIEQEQDLVMRIDSVEKPGRNILTTDDVYFYGLPQRRAWGSSFTEMPVTVLCSEDYREKLYFEEWQDQMVGTYRDGELSPSMYDIRYFSDYAGTVEITTYSDTGEPKYVMRLFDAFPIVVGSVQLSWQTGNEIARLPVTFAFSRYTDS